jgi:superoxide dismutase, Cu-Zn family
MAPIRLSGRANATNSPERWEGETSTSAMEAATLSRFKGGRKTMIDRPLARLCAVAGLAALLLAPVAGEASEMARAAMQDDQGKSVGTIEMRQTPHGVLLIGRLDGLPPGPHAFHIHGVGKCEPPFTSAGGHFNPAGKKHGLLVADGHHAGDLPNLHVPASGALTFEMLAPAVSLVAGAAGDLFDADGSSIIVHAGVDDYKSDPTGDAGGRIACGIVTK